MSANDLRKRPAVIRWPARLPVWMHGLAMRR